MSILISILGLLVFAILMVLLLALGKPDEFKVQRSLAISSSPEFVLPWIVDLHRWTAWSPWENLDSDLRRTYMGARSGLGAQYAWEGRKSGKGTMEIVEVDPSRRIVLRLAFEKPFKATHRVDFVLDREDGQTRVTWIMSGVNTLFPGKLFQVFVNQDTFLGKDFERGLASLKRSIETAP